MRHQFFAGAALAALVMPVAAYAQETTSSIRGTVTSGTSPVAGATVTVTHIPSGTTSSSTTDSDGNFSANGLRVGGPFTVTVSASGYEESSVTDISLNAGQPLRLPITIEQASEIIVTASRSQALETSSGPITSLGREAIEGVASVTRDIRDIARRDAFVTIDSSNARTIEIAGQNGRLNRFSVDGVQLSDDFGINNGGLPTSRGPVPFDAIEQLSVKVAPYDISEGDFQGGAVNVVLRSGGNRFTGSAFYTYSNDSLTGDKIRGAPVNLEFTSKQYGGFISGPIVKDKLFFAFAYEKLKESDPIDEGPGDAGFAVAIPRVSSALANQISSIANTVYGYDTLGVFENAVEQDEKFVAKLDWNVTDDHRASLTYIRNVGNQQISQNNVTNITGPTLGFKSNGYELTEEINSGSFQLNSQWSDSFSTELRVSYRDYNRGQTPFGESAAQFEVCTDPTSVNNSALGNTLTSCGNTLTSNPRFFFGPDISRQANQLNTENFGIELTPKLELGSHNIKAVIGYAKTDTFNLFLQRATGDIYFDSIADFQARIASRVRLANAVPSLDVNNAAAAFSTSNFTFGLQDDWDLSDSLRVTLAGRYDLQDGDTPIPLNTNFLARAGFPNNRSFSGLGVFQPRFGFEWTPADRFILRGGVGKFAGGAPDVFLSNSFSNTGQLTNAIDIQRTTTAATCNSGDLAFCTTALTGITGNSFPGAVTAFLATNTAGLAAAPVNAIDPGYRLPAQWRSTLSASYEADLGPFGDGWLFGADLLYGWTAAANTYVDVRSVVVGTLPDGRPRYARTTQGILAGDTNQTNQDLVLRSTGRGRSIIGVARVEKSWDWGLDIGASYTRSDIKDVNPITSATAGSLYGNAAMSDPNNAAYGRSIYEFTDQVKFNVDFNHAFFGDYKTRIGLFGEWRSGRPFSYTMRDPSTGRSAVFGTNGSNTRYLLYVPTGTTDPLVSYDSAATQASLDGLINGSKLSKYRGSIAPKNLGTSPGYWKVDLHFDQELPTFIGKSRVKLFADVENFLNLLDSDWGVQRQVAFAYFAPVVNVQCLTTAVATGTAPAGAQINTVPTQTCAQYRYSSYADPNITVQNQNKQSLYQIRVGVRFEF